MFTYQAIMWHLLFINKTSMLIIRQLHQTHITASNFLSTTIQNIIGRSRLLIQFDDGSTTKHWQNMESRTNYNKEVQFGWLGNKTAREQVLRLLTCTLSLLPWKTKLCNIPDKQFSHVVWITTPISIWTAHSKRGEIFKILSGEEMGNMSEACVGACSTHPQY
jgi:hypothetical protein